MDRDLIVDILKNHDEMQKEIISEIESIDSQCNEIRGRYIYHSSNFDVSINTNISSKNYEDMIDKVSSLERKKNRLMAKLNEINDVYKAIFKLDYMFLDLFLNLYYSKDNYTIEKYSELLNVDSSTIYRRKNNAINSLCLSLA